MGIIYSSVAIIIALVLFYEYASLIMVFFTVMTSIPIIYWAIKLEEKKDLQIHDERVLIKEHGKALAFFMFMFLGVSCAGASGSNVIDVRRGGD